MTHPAPATSEDQSLRERVQRIDTLLQGIERYKDAHAKIQTREIVQGLMDLHGTALERILQHLASTGDAGLALIDDLARDGVIASVMLLYGLHPQSLDARVREALEAARPALRKHDARVELLDTADGIVRLQLHATGGHLPEEAVVHTLHEAIYEKAPDVAGIQIEDAAGHALGAGADIRRVALPVLAT